MDSTMESPSPDEPSKPDEPFNPEREASARAKREKILLWNSAGIPGPSSVTVTTTLPSADRITPVTTVVPVSVCLRALESRLARTWWS